MIPNKDTKLYFSVSSNPGNFGATIYNSAFEYLAMNALYLPIKINDATAFSLFLKTCENICAKGISVSMPFKKQVWRECVHGDDFVALVRNGNTIVMQYDVCFGYNTDIVGFERSCEEFLKNSKTAIVVGSGAVSDTICCVLKTHGLDYQIIKREDKLPLERYEADFLINASPIGMNDLYPNTIFTKDVVKNYKYVFDVVVNNSTDLLNISRELNKDYRSGVSMVYYGLMRQFELYTNHIIPESFLLNKIKDMGLNYEKLVR